MGGRYCAINSPLGPRWGQKSLDLRSRDFCPHLEPRGELIAQYRPPMSFRYRSNWQDVRESLDTCVIYIFTAQESKRGFIFKWYCRTFDDIFQIIWMGYFNIIYIYGVNARNVNIYIIKSIIWNGGLFMHISLKLLVIGVIVTEHVLQYNLFPRHNLYHKKLKVYI